MAVGGSALIAYFLCKVKHVKEVKQLFQEGVKQGFWLL